MSKVDLCEELIVEIFSRLPTKSLLRFRSVSKSLRALIGSPDFIRFHALRSPKKLTIIHRIPGESKSKRMYTIHSDGQLSSYAGTTPVDYPFVRYSIMVGSCNGIICVYEPYERDGIHLWNPSIRLKATIYDLPSHGGASFVLLGFGFDPITEDYKIVRILKEDAGTFVYTMKTRVWREIGPPATEITCVNSYQCLFNGGLHWVIGVDRDDCHYRYIMAFDLSSEVFSTIDLPEPSNWRTTQVTIFKGCLAVICSEIYDVGWRIWVRNTAASSWSVACRLNRYEQATHGALLFRHNSEGGIIFYNPETETRSTLVCLTDSSWIVRDGVMSCIESLELLDTAGDSM